MDGNTQTRDKAYKCWNANLKNERVLWEIGHRVTSIGPRWHEPLDFLHISSVNEIPPSEIMMSNYIFNLEYRYERERLVHIIVRWNGEFIVAMHP